MKPVSNINVAHKKDIEKNIDVDFQGRPKAIILTITVLEIISIAALIHHRDYIDSLHQMLNSVLLGSITAGFAQSTIQLCRYVNYPRLYKFYIWGALNGIISSLWIDTLVLQIPTISARILVDQVIGSPFFQAIFIVYNCVWEDTDIVPALKATYLRMLLTSYMIWPLCSIISFNALPQYYIFPFNCLINVIWTVVLGILV